MSDPEAWNRRTAERLEQAYRAGGAGPGGSGSRETSAGAWRAKRQHLCVPMDGDGTWLDVGCANGHLLATSPAGCAERDIRFEPYGLELLPALAELARSLDSELAERIWTGSVMSWKPARRFTYVTALDDQVPPGRLGDLVARLRSEFVEAGGRLIVSSYTDSNGAPRPLFDDLSDAGYPPDGRINIDRPRRHPLLSAWIDA
jgi:hypothetical protein